MKATKNEGILGSIPESVESIAELMLQDSDINVYQQRKVVLKEEKFCFGNKKQSLKAQAEDLAKRRWEKA